MSESANRRRSELVCFGLLAASVLLGALALAKVAGFFQTQRVLARMRSLGAQDPNDLQVSVRRATESAEALKKNNLFVKQASKQHPVKQVDGILGSEALIAGKWYTVGGRIGDAEIVAISSTDVTVAWNGQKKSFAPLAAANAPQGPPSKPAEKPEAAKAPEPGKAARQQAAPVETKAAAAPPEDDPLSWLGVNLSPRMREMLLAKWNSASEEDKAKAKEQWNKMPEGERQRAIDMMEQNL